MDPLVYDKGLNMWKKSQTHTYTLFLQCKI